MDSTLTPLEAVPHSTVLTDPDLACAARADACVLIIGRPNAGKVLCKVKGRILDKILFWEKQVVYILPATDVLDPFSMRDERMICPHFEPLKLTSNGCFYRCEWGYLKLTYRVGYSKAAKWKMTGKRGSF